MIQNSFLRGLAALFLHRCFVLQSSLQFGSRPVDMPFYRRRQRSVWRIYTLICLAALTAQLSEISALKAFVLGLVFPGAGFVYGLGAAASVEPLIFLSLSLMAFACAIVIWFATGNVLMPVATYLAAAIFAAYLAPASPSPTGHWLGLGLGLALPLLAPLVAAIGLSFHNLQRAFAWLPPKQTAAKLLPVKPLTAKLPAPKVHARTEITQADEIPLEDLQRLKLLMDRALQPVDQFNGFEWRDQFQTAAVRYQINFLSYALSIAQRTYCPAATAYFETAQQNLLNKQGNHRIWRYWALENAWGNLRLDRNPVPKDNIMYTGFIGLQMALSGTDAPLSLHRGDEAWKQYSLSEMADILAQQYRAAPYGLLACEPNWIYPVCNLITALGMRGADAQDGSARWSEMSAKFRQKLESEFTTSHGDFVAFRSSLTGIAPPSPGGAVMQAFPCLFLNGLFPDLAQQHWERLRESLQNANWNRAFWPIDVGNYGFSRASSYAASAAAAVEMGDGDMAQQFLHRLEVECPSQQLDGTPYRPKASLWAHSLEMCARLSHKDALRNMVTQQPCEKAAGQPFVSNVPYRDAMLAKARYAGDALEIVLYPNAGSKTARLELGGLTPGQQYQTNGAPAHILKADIEGKAAIDIRLSGRTHITIKSVI